MKIEDEYMRILISKFSPWDLETYYKSEHPIISHQIPSSDTFSHLLSSFYLLPTLNLL